MVIIVASGKYDPKMIERIPAKPKIVRVIDQRAMTIRMMMNTRSFVMRHEPTKLIAGSEPSFVPSQNFSQMLSGSSPGVGKIVASY
jgi:hypothetical protein